MAIIKENNYYTGYYSIEGLTAWIKTGQYKNINGDIKEVITSLVITKENNKKEVVYKYESYNSFISYYYDKDGFSLSDIIENLLIYIAHNETEEYFKNRFIENALNNGYKGISVLKRFKIKYEQDQKERIILQEIKELEVIEKKLLTEVKSIVNNINNKVEIKLISPNKYNNYNYEIYTKKGHKSFEIGSSIRENIKYIKSMLDFLKEYDNLLMSDIIPEYFLKFDKVV